MADSHLAVMLATAAASAAGLPMHTSMLLISLMPMSTTATLGWVADRQVTVQQTPPQIPYVVTCTQ